MSDSHLKEIGDWRYLGCHIIPGHYVFRPGMIIPGHYVFQPGMRPSAQTELDRRLRALDGLLPLRGQQPFVANFVRVPAIQYSALAWWDTTIDQRPGSNSVVFAPSLTIDPFEVMMGFEALFPEVYDRMPSIDMSLITLMQNKYPVIEGA